MTEYLLHGLRYSTIETGLNTYGIQFGDNGFLYLLQK